MFTEYGYKTMSIGIIISTIVICISIFIPQNFIKYFLIILASVFIIFTLYFFRDPQRTSPNANNVLVSPADGKVIVIKDVFEDEFIKEKCIQISIFMSPLNVHVNRIPIDGKVGYVKYHKGQYLVASHDKASELNERNAIGIESRFGKILYTQVAGYVARRIVCNLHEGQDVKIGEKFGMIKFGSRVDVIVPKNWKVKVKEGDVVRAAETILFETGN